IDCEARGPRDCAPGLFVIARETVCKHDPIAGGTTVLHRLINNVVALLRRGCPIPRAVERDEGAASIRGWELCGLVNRERVRRPVRRKECPRPLLLPPPSHCFPPVSAVFGREHQLLLKTVEIAGGPAVIPPFLEVQQLFGRQLRSLFRLIEFRPVL